MIIIESYLQHSRLYGYGVFAQQVLYDCGGVGGNRVHLQWTLALELVLIEYGNCFFFVVDESIHPQDKLRSLHSLKSSYNILVDKIVLASEDSYQLLCGCYVTKGKVKVCWQIVKIAVKRTFMYGIYEWQIDILLYTFSSIK